MSAISGFAAPQRVGDVAARQEAGCGMFGRSDDEWDAMVDDAIAFLFNQARLRRIVSYSELNSA